MKTLDQTVPVDAYLPGCPPEAERIWEALQALMSGEPIPAGTVIGAGTTVCDDCKRKRNEKTIGAIKRTWQVIPAWPNREADLAAFRAWLAAYGTTDMGIVGSVKLAAMAEVLAEFNRRLRGCIGAGPRHIRYDFCVSSI